MTPGALDGIRIFEFASYVSGPYAGMLLSDLGAEVVKVETPDGGDPFRMWGKTDYNGTFGSMNRNKKSVTLDLKTEAGRAAAHKLALCADVIIENMRAGAMERFRTRLRGVGRRQPSSRLLLDHRLRLGGPVSRPAWL